MTGDGSAQDRRTRLDRIYREMDLIAVAIDAFLNRNDAGRFGAGLERRATSIAIMLLALARRSAISLSATADRARDQLHDFRQRIHLKKPPAKWAGA